MLLCCHAAYPQYSLLRRWCHDTPWPHPVQPAAPARGAHLHRHSALDLTGAQVSGQAITDGFNGNLFDKNVSSVVPQTGYGNSDALPVDLAITDNQVEFGLAVAAPVLLITADFQTSGVMKFSYTGGIVVAISYTFTSAAFRQAKGQFKVTDNTFQTVDPEISLDGDTLKINIPALNSIPVTRELTITLFAVGDDAV